MRTIYTTERISVTGVEVLGIERLAPKRRQWVIATRRRLLRSMTVPEKAAAGALGHLAEKPVRQAFFMIRGRSYFLDFFFPCRMTAVEIDGSVHRTQREHDRRRDADFRSIGIRTIRIRNTDVMAGRLFDKLFKRLYK